MDAGLRQRKYHLARTGAPAPLRYLAPGTGGAANNGDLSGFPLAGVAAQESCEAKFGQVDAEGFSRFAEAGAIAGAPGTPLTGRGAASLLLATERATLGLAAARLTLPLVDARTPWTPLAVLARSRPKPTISAAFDFHTPIGALDRFRLFAV